MQEQTEKFMETETSINMQMANKYTLIIPRVFSGAHVLKGKYMIASPRQAFMDCTFIVLKNIFISMLILLRGYFSSHKFGKWCLSRFDIIIYIKISFIKCMCYV